jgi:surfactin family lipopeptide synthetase A
VQEDVEDNSFANYVKFISKLGCIADIMDQVEISPVDITAQAIVKLFDKAELKNNTYHVFNPYLVQLSKLLEADGRSIATVSFENFIDRLINYLQGNDDCDLVSRFLLRIDLKDNQNIFGKFKLSFLQNKTHLILLNLDFKWLQSPQCLYEEYVTILFGNQAMNLKITCL